MEETNPKIIIFNVAAKAIPDSFDAVQAIADWLHAPTGWVHRCVSLGSVSAFFDDTCPTLSRLEHPVLATERTLQRSLYELAQEGYRIFILMNAEKQPYHACVLALYALIVAYSRVFPAILSIQLRDDTTYEISAEIDLVSFLQRQGGALHNA